MHEYDKAELLNTVANVTSNTVSFSPMEILPESRFFCDCETNSSFDRNTYANHENTATIDKKKKFATTPNTVESSGQWNMKYLQDQAVTMSCTQCCQNATTKTEQAMRRID